MKPVPLILLAAAAMSPAMAPAQQPQPFATFDLASEAVLDDPHDLALGPNGHIYIADKFGARIAVMDAETMQIVTMLGAGALPNVHDISFGPEGRAVIAVTGASAVAVYDDVARAGMIPDLVLSAPQVEGVLAHSNGTIYAMASGIGALLAYRGKELVAVAEGHPGAHDVEEDLQGNIWVADNFNRRLVKYAPDLTELAVIDGPDMGFVGPRYMDIDDFGRLIVADQDAHRILMIDPDGPALVGVLGDGLPGIGPGKFDDPEGVLVMGSRFYFADSDNNRIVRYSVVLN